MAANRAAAALIGVALLAAGYFALLSRTQPPAHIQETEPSLLWRFSAEPSASAAPLRPLPAAIEVDERKARLGERLFHDPRLSPTTASPARCHDLGMGGADGRSASIGLAGARSAVNTPTVLNSGFNAAQFWDGRVSTLEEQIDGRLSHPEELGGAGRQAAGRCRLSRSFRRDLSAGHSAGRHRRLRSLITPNAPFDRYLRGEQSAISEDARAGYALFTSYGCISCHQGINLGGNLFQKLGVVVPRHKNIGYFKTADLGRYNVTGRDRDRFVFKVPSLRNVALTAPISTTDRRRRWARPSGRWAGTSWAASSPTKRSRSSPRSSTP